MVQCKVQRLITEPSHHSHSPRIAGKKPSFVYYTCPSSLARLTLPTNILDSVLMLQGGGLRLPLSFLAGLFCLYNRHFMGHGEALMKKLHLLNVCIHCRAQEAFQENKTLTVSAVSKLRLGFSSLNCISRFVEVS